MVGETPPVTSCRKVEKKKVECTGRRNFSAVLLLRS